MALGLGVGAILVLTFLQLVNLRAVALRLEHLNVLFALLCGVVFLGAYAVRALRWRRFLAPDRVPRRRVIAIYFVAVFLNWALPIQGGELAKSLMLRRSDGIPVNRSLATVGMDKAMDLLPGVVLIAVVPFAHWHVRGLLWVLLSLASLVLVVGMTVLAFASWRRDRTLAWISWFLGLILPQRVWNRVDPFIAGFVDTLLALIRRPRLLLIATGYTAVAACLDALFCFLAFRAVGASVSVPVALFGYTFFNLMYILPTPPGHVGSNELIGLLVFSGVFGVSHSAVGAMFLFSHPWTALLMTISGLVCLRWIGLGVRATLELGFEPEPIGEAIGELIGEE
jgi:uncharacterized protein (TIRG00374 family)